ncbi:flagellar hook-length control protein FliK [Brevundimonas sp.]|uniref:flagellar hook-length control protein FliK n=1 Tax=Brevundimonas sp. TaxID=1871086 RepID=UPI0025BBBE82|nr:flagellar hook-length control protein FliK [Brevundimonas sp.]
MSALTLLSVIAPAVPNAPQGSSGEAASGFQSLLAALSGEPDAAPVTKSGAVTPAPVETAAGPDADADGDATDVAGFLTAPAPPAVVPVPLVLPAEGAAPAADGDAVAAEGDKSGAAPATLPPADDLVDEARTTPLPPVDKGPTPKTDDPQVQPAVIDARPSPKLVRETPPPTLAEAAAATEALEAQARTGAAPAPSTPPPAAPPPPPLRALAERTSRPQENPAGATGDGPRPNDPAPARPTAAVATAAPGPVAPPAGPADFIAAAAREAAAADGSEAEAPASELLPPGEGSSTQTQAPAAARETVVSQLSRATVEATAQIAAQILRRLEGRSTRFEMALTPDELGRVDVKLDIDSEGRLNARLAFDNPVAATDLRGRADELRRQLEDAGFHLAADAFEFAERDSGSSAFDRGQDARNGSSRAFAAASRLNNEIDVAQPPQWLALSLSPSGVDMKV